MAGGVSDDELQTIGPFPAGVNNVAKEHQLPRNEGGTTVALRQAVNVDLDNVGWPSRRAGRQLRVAAARAHSLYAGDEPASADYLYAIVDGDLRAYTPDLALAATIRADVGERFASYAQLPDEIVWTNGLEIRRIVDLVDGPAALPTPAAPQVAASLAGGMDAGEYQVSLTWFDAAGRESGASAPVFQTIPANGGLALTGLPAATESATRLRVYCSAPDGEVLYAAADLPAGQPAYFLGAHQPGRALETLWMVPLPPGDLVRFWQGRVLVAAGNQLCWSQALRFALMHQDDSVRVGERITLLEPVDEAGDGPGVYVADHKTTYFFAGTGPDTWQKSRRYPHSAVPGTAVTAPGTAFGLDTTKNVVCWLATNGVFVLGLPGGQIKPLTEGALALPEAERGTALYREFDGFRQIFMSFIAGGSNAFSFTDTAVATVRRNGVAVPG